jgi:hypothetical protein
MRPCNHSFSRSRALSFRQDRPGAKRTNSLCGYTLAEAMVASTVFAMIMLGVYAMLIRSYQMAALSRCRDDGRAVIRTFADQFERLQTTDQIPPPNGPSYTRWLFFPEGGPTGRGLNWGALSDANVTTILPPVSSLAITLGDPTHPVAATVTRDVAYIDDTSGAPSVGQQIKAAGYLMRGTFTVNFSLNSKNYSQSLTVVRAVP